MKCTTTVACALAATAGLFASAVASRVAAGRRRPKKLTLIYFDVSGVAEPIRICLHASGLEWEDKRVSKEEFATLKPTLPYGQLPVLVIDTGAGPPVFLPQSHAILHYAATFAPGWYPSADPLSAARVDAGLACTVDLNEKMRPSLTEKDDEKRLALRAELAVDIIPKWLSQVQKQLEEAGGKFFGGGDTITVADTSIAFRLRWLSSGILDGIPTKIIDPFPTLRGHMERVMAHPAVCSYYASIGK
jgi:glutathione S-transferase